jgi:NitT/TauT family transport system ATP-binding protein
MQLDELRMSESSLTIAVDGLSVAYERDGRRIEVLQDISFSIGAGQFVSILGPSGCGKSTLLRVITGSLLPTAGSVRVGSRTPQGAREQQLIGVVFQNAVMLPWLNLQDNVAFLLEARGVGRRERIALAGKYIELVGLSGFEHHMPWELSGGMEQRASIARALAFRPSVLLMDEPFGAVDVMTRDRLAFDLLDIWRETQKTVLFVTHSVHEAVLLSDVVIVMSARPGRIRAVREIRLPRPRTREARRQPEFHEHLEELMRDVEAL